MERDPTGRSAHTDGVKLDDGKVPVWQGVLDYFPRALAAVAEVSAHGAAKYLWGGWKTVPDGLNRFANAEVRHMLARARGEERDRDSGLLHRAHEAWNALSQLERYLLEQEKAAVGPKNGAEVLAERGTPLPKPACHCRGDECMVEKGTPPKFVYCKRAEEVDRIGSPYAKDGKQPCNCDVNKNGCWQKQSGLDLSRGVYCKA